MTEAAEARPEFSRLLPLEAITESARPHLIEATAEERRALARRLGLVRIARLSAALQVSRPSGGEVIKLCGRLEGEMTQSCVVTLAEIDIRLNEDVALEFKLCEPEDSRGQPLEFDVESEDPPEAVGPQGLDLGEAVVQQLAVCLAPYPRAADARLEQTSWGGEAGQASSPFAALKALKDDA